MTKACAYLCNLCLYDLGGFGEFDENCTITLQYHRTSGTTDTDYINSERHAKWIGTILRTEHLLRTIVKIPSTFQY